MHLQLSSINKPKIGSCPHGLPAGACPICSGMGGGGGASAKKADSHVGEMSWDECYAVWQQMLREKASQQKNRDFQAQIQTANFGVTTRPDLFQQKMSNLIEKLSSFSQKDSALSQNLPKIIAKPLAILAKVAVPILNVVKNVVVTAQKAMNFIQQKFADISDKLSAIFGEIKNSKEKKISDRFKDATKKFKTLFGIFTVQDVKNEKEIIENDHK